MNKRLSEIIADAYDRVVTENRQLRYEMMAGMAGPMTARPMTARPMTAGIDTDNMVRESDKAGGPAPETNGDLLADIRAKNTQLEVDNRALRGENEALRAQMALMVPVGQQAGTYDMIEFQRNVIDWITECFGPEVLKDTEERALRFFEEAVELAQAAGLAKAMALELVIAVYAKEPGTLANEIGGVSNTLASLADTFELSQGYCARQELARCWRDIDKIRIKGAMKKLRTGTKQKGDANYVGVVEKGHERPINHEAG